MAGRGRDIRAGRAFVEFAVNRREFERSLRAIGKRLQRFGASIASVGAKFAAVGSVLAAPFVASIGVFAKVGDSLDKMSQRTGFAVEALSQLGFAAEQSGSGIGSLEKGIKTMQRGIIDLERGLSTQVFSFGQLGLAIKDLEKLSPEDQFTLIADRVSKIEDPTRKAAVALQIFGRSGQELLPLLSGGAEGIALLRDEADKLGITIDTDTSKKAAALTDAFNRLKRQVVALAVNIGAALGPALTRISGFLSSFGKPIIEFAKNNARLITVLASAAAGITVFGVALIGIGTTIGLAGFAISSIAGLLGALLSPFALVAAAVAGAGVAFLAFTDQGRAMVDFLREKLGGLLDFTRETFGLIADAVEGGDIEIAGKILWASLKLIFFEGVQGVIKEAIKLKEGVLTEITKTTLGAIELCNQLFSDLQGVWVKISTGAREAWQNIKGDAIEAFNAVVVRATKLGNAVRAELHSGFDEKSADLRADRGFVASQNLAQNIRRSGLAAIKGDRDARIKAIEAIRDARTAAIALVQDAELKAIQEGSKAEAKRLSEHLEGLRAQREELKKQLEAIREAENAPRVGDAPAIAPAESGYASLRAAASVLGATSSFDIRSVGASAGTDERILDVSERQLGKLKDIDARLAEQVVGAGFAIN